MNDDQTPKDPHDSAGPAALAHLVHDEIDGRARLMPVLADNMEPTLRRGDVVAVLPVNDYCGEGIYAFALPIGGVFLRRCGAAAGGGVRLTHDNPLYRSAGNPDVLSRAQMREMVLGRAAAVCRRLR